MNSSIIIFFLTVLMFLWDVVTWPIYQVIYRPWKVRRDQTRVRSRQISQGKEGDNVEAVVFEAEPKRNLLHDDFSRAGCDTMAKAWSWAVSRHGNRELLGTRQVLAAVEEENEHDERERQGKPETQPLRKKKSQKKLELGEYKWQSYAEVDAAAENFGQGLRLLGLEHGQKVGIYAETRSEWFVAAQACFKQGFVLVTLYTNLGEDGVVDGLNQTLVTYVVTSHDLLPKLRSVLSRALEVTTVIYFEDQLQPTDLSEFTRKEEGRRQIAVASFRDIVARGKSSPLSIQPRPPSESDPAIIMYTSGSAGVPKGVVMSHRNLIAVLRSTTLSLDLRPRQDETFIAYLPLAHVMELECETVMYLYGIRIGYSTPNTLSDKSLMIRRGSRGDASVLRPTIMPAVPLILNRVYKTITAALKQRGEVFERVFRHCYQYRLAAVRNGEQTPILDFFIFRKIRALFGGKIRVMITGGAPLSKETHEFVRNCLGCPIIQGYGLTETCACATLMELSEGETSLECVGPPMQGNRLKLVSWKEGGYSVTDRPRPRGEVVMGGDVVAEGYYDEPALTEESFYRTADGWRWFRTGDIGRVEVDGTLRLIDRKKDLVKLQLGEYVSLGKVESALKTCPVVENICAYGDSSKSYIVALVCPDQAALSMLMVAASKKSSNGSFEDLYRDEEVVAAVLQQVAEHGRACGLERFEIPAAVSLCKDVWGPETGLVTAAFKLKRKSIQEFYQTELEKMYGA